MDATLQFVRSGPATGPLFLVRARRARAGDAADRAVAGVVQRVVRNVVGGYVVPDVLLPPVGERLDLPDAVALGALRLLRARARGRLLAANPRDPRIVGIKRLDERLYLADVAAAVGVGFPEVRPLLLVLLGDGDDLGA